MTPEPTDRELAEPDLTDPATYRRTDYLALWRAVRRHRPIARLDSPRYGPFWSVTTHDLACQVLEDPVRFTSTRGMRLGADEAAVGAAAGRMLVVADGAEHARLRAAHAPWFRSNEVAAMRDALRRRLETELEPMVTGEPVEIVQRLASAVPTWVVGRMLGTDDADTARLAALVRTAFAEETDPAEHTSRRAASAHVFGYFADLLENRRADPRADVVSALAHEPDPERRLTDEEILLSCDGLVNGGLGTSRHAVSGTLLAFARHPDQWLRLRRDASLLPSAVEEVLRWASPPMHLMRTATREVELGGARIGAGDRVVLWIPSCNRDESVFAEPDAFRIDRRPNRHLSLGAGPHYCVGASVGRMEVRVLLQVLLARVDRIELRAEPVRSASTFLHGLDRLEVVLLPIHRADREVTV
ncbi:cytochrome P450 [Micromonospora sp. C31]|uniref:cytochrome P450 n=1 Tax=Micromonospora sp. C31 TaxID=2824876 RepID=UPI001B38B171|nr:cytochrome P450 [Micromonospora sp. C31]MBQ1076378.1 cytochrome P450 [Micromonospora sp. C31]